MSGKFYKNFKKFTLELKIILCATLLFLISPPVFILVFFPIYIFRYFLQIFVRPLVRPDLVGLVPLRSSIWSASDRTFDSAPECNIVIAIVFEGQLSRELLYDDIKTLLIDCEDSKGRKKYAELTYTYVNWLGFNWFKKEEDFNLKNHVKIFENPTGIPIDEDGLNKIRCDLDRKPWPKGQSPWMVQIIPNFCEKSIEEPADQYQKSNGDKSVLIISIHHSLSDGLSIISILLNGFRKHGIFSNENIQEPKFMRWSWAKIIWEWCSFPFKVPYMSSSQILRSMDSNELKNEKLKIDKIMMTAQSHMIPIDFIKEIKQAHGVSFTAILLSAISGGLRKFMLKNKMEIPESVHFVSSFPIPVGKPDKLGNFYSFVFTELNVGTPDPSKRVQLAQKNILKLKTSLYPIINFISIPIIGGLLTPMTRYLFKNRYTTGILSNFPGPNNVCQYQGLKVCDVQFFGGTMCGETGLGISFLSYNGFLRINTGLSTTFSKSPQMTQELLQFVLEEFSILHHCQNV